MAVSRKLLTLVPKGLWLGLYRGVVGCAHVICNYGGNGSSVVFGKFD